jgi:hypothetical protein
MIHQEPRPDAAAGHSSGEDDEEDFVVVQVNPLNELIASEYIAHVDELTELITELNVSPDTASVNDSIRRVNAALAELTEIRRLLSA